MEFKAGNLIIIALTTCCLFGLVSAMNPPARKCGYEKGTFVGMDVTNCTDQPCLFAANQTMTIKTTFNPIQTVLTGLHMEIEYYCPYQSTKETSYNGAVPGAFLSGTEYTTSKTFQTPGLYNCKAGYFHLQLWDPRSQYYLVVIRCFDAKVSPPSNNADYGSINNGNNLIPQLSGDKISGGLTSFGNIRLETQGFYFMVVYCIAFL